jgi:hypothetical protein
VGEYDLRVQVGVVFHVALRAAQFLALLVPILYLSAAGFVGGDEGVDLGDREAGLGGGLVLMCFALHLISPLVGSSKIARKRKTAGNAGTQGTVE